MFSVLWHPRASCWQRARVDLTAGRLVAVVPRGGGFEQRPESVFREKLLPKTWPFSITQATLAAVLVEHSCQSGLNWCPQLTRWRAGSDTEAHWVAVQPCDRPLLTRLLVLGWAIRGPYSNSEGARPLPARWRVTAVGVAVAAAVSEGGAVRMRGTGARCPTKDVCVMHYLGGLGAPVR